MGKLAINQLHNMLSTQALKSNGGTTYRSIGRQVRKAMKAHDCSTIKELFFAYIQQNSLAEDEWLHLLFCAADIVDERIEAAGINSNHREAA